MNFSFISYAVIEVTECVNNFSVAQNSENICEIKKVINFLGLFITLNMKELFRFVCSSDQYLLSSYQIKKSKTVPKVCTD